MKTTLTLEFDEKEYKDLKRQVKANDMANVLFDLQFNVKKQMLHDERNDPETVERVFERISHLFEQANVNMDELID